MVDDFFHDEIGDPGALQGQGEQAAALFRAAEAARAKRGGRAVLVVCPAAWISKRQLLERLGYRNAITWHIRMAG